MRAYSLRPLTAWLALTAFDPLRKLAVSAHVGRDCDGGGCAETDRVAIVVRHEGRNMRAIIICLLAAAVATPAFAGYISNRTQWNALGSAKQDYAAGLLDGMYMTWTEDDAQAANIQGTENCLSELGISGRDLADLIDRGYADPSSWGKSPLLIMSTQVGRMCRPYVNRERVAKGLDSWPEIEAP